MVATVPLTSPALLGSGLSKVKSQLFEGEVSFVHCHENSPSSPEETIVGNRLPSFAVRYAPNLLEVLLVSPNSAIANVLLIHVALPEVCLCNHQPRTDIGRTDAGGVIIET